MRIKIEIEIPERLLIDALTGIEAGGCNYWLSVNNIIKDENSDVVRYTDPTNPEGDSLSEEVPGYLPTDITIDTIAAGIQRIFDQGVLPMRSDIRTRILQACLDADDHYLDAEDYDVLLQLGMFHELIYG